MVASSNPAEVDDFFFFSGGKNPEYNSSQMDLKAVGESEISDLLKNLKPGKINRPHFDEMDVV